MKISAIKANHKNPRRITNQQAERLLKSIEQFPQMMEIRPIVVDDSGTILGGNMRFQALKRSGYKDIPDSWVRRADDLTEQQKREFIIKDNAGFGEWDWDALGNEWDDLPLAEWGVDVPTDWAGPVKDDKPVDLSPQVRQDADSCRCPKCGFEFVP
jgi:hypothetical protein